MNVNISTQLRSARVAPVEGDAMGIADEGSTATPAAVGSRHIAQRPFAVGQVRLISGRLAQWQARNAHATIPHCIDQLEVSGVLDNLRRVIGESGAQFRGFWFADSDLYKVIEAVAWEIARSGTNEFDGWLDDVIGLLERVQEPSGYLHSFIQGVHPEQKFANLELHHELYVLGHLIQAAVALARANGRQDLLGIARAFADLVDRRFGPGREDGVCGHPEIETVLVELFRETGEPRYLALAQRQIDLRGRGLLTPGAFGPQYFQDHLPVRESRDAVGHAVRQLYLNAGVTDLYLETGEPALLAAMDAQWASAHERKMYLSGAFGSRHRDEAFGDDYELPSDRAYAETCATIADLHWSWRMLLAGGEAGPARYAETIEREIYNALAAALDESGTRFFYSNPLQLRPDRYSEENAPRERTPWYSCACCPPNIARALAQLSAYVASYDESTIWIHQLADVEIDLPDHLGSGVVEISTGYPYDGDLTVSIRGDVAEHTRLALRVPTWAGEVQVVDGTGETYLPQDGYLHLPITAGRSVTATVDLSPRWSRAHHRVDAVRGCVALERGPLLYCIETADLPGGVALDDLEIRVGGELSVHSDGRIDLECAVVPVAAGLYRALAEPTNPTATITVPAVPFFTWGNRSPGAMRVWLPVAPLA